VATDAYNLTSGVGPEWDHICQMGREIDPANAMYHPGGHPGEAALGAAAAGAALGTGTFGETSSQPLFEHREAGPSQPMDLDLDLDFSAGDEDPRNASSFQDAAQKTVAVQAPAAPAAPRDSMFALGAASAPAPLDMSFAPTAKSAPELPAFELPPVPPAPATETVKLDAPDLTLDENTIAFTTEPLPTAAPVSPAATAAKAPDAGMIEFDLGSLSLDLPGSTPAAAATAGGANSLDFDAPGEDPLATKLALAEEFNAIGDADGARSLAEEVLAEASGELRSRAQRLLAEIG